MSQRVYLGIDTSCYTTSVAIMDEAGALLGEARQILSVRPGRCGLQQSEMVFQHTRNLPRLMEEAVGQVLGVAKSTEGEGAEGAAGAPRRAPLSGAMGAARRLFAAR